MQNKVDNKTDKLHTNLIINSIHAILMIPSMTALLTLDTHTSHLAASEII